MKIAEQYLEDTRQKDRDIFPKAPRESRYHHGGPKISGKSVETNIKLLTKRALFRNLGVHPCRRVSRRVVVKLKVLAI
uniref:Uncharacterized protein n=1 Tax=Onchocerca volvulus TaxID=6282 RepID=A0A8R1XX08_ONCVO